MAKAKTQGKEQINKKDPASILSSYELNNMIMFVNKLVKRNFIPNHQQTMSHIVRRFLPLPNSKLPDYK